MMQNTPGKHMTDYQKSMHHIEYMLQDAENRYLCGGVIEELPDDPDEDDDYIDYSLICGQMGP